MDCAVGSVLQPWQSCMQGAALGSWVAPGQVWGALIQLGKRVARTGLRRSVWCHSSNAVCGARTRCLSQGLGQSCNHRAAEFPLLLEDVGSDAVC